MKRLVLLACTVFLCSCSSIQAPKLQMSWPAVPDELKTACPDLDTVADGTNKLSEALEVVGKNYGTYYTCKDRVDSWIEWYSNQQKIYNSVK